MKQEHEYLEYKRLGQKLGIPTFEAFLELEVRMPDGRVIHRHRQRSHSWTRNAYNMLFSQLAGKDASDSTFEAGKLSGKEPDGTVKYGAAPMGQYPGSTIDDTAYGYRAPAGNDAKGILVGSGTNAESFEDYVLQTQIADGTSAGELSHVESEAHAITYVGLVLKNTLIRYFNNNSGGSVAVNEVALVGYLYAGISLDPFLMSRDKLGSTITVPATGKLTVTYTISLTYPS